MRLLASLKLWFFQIRCSMHAHQEVHNKLHWDGRLEKLGLTSERPAPGASITSLQTPDPSSPNLNQVRMVEARPGIAFVEYENEAQSGVAMGGLQSFKVTPQNAMAISYAKQ